MAEVTAPESKEVWQTTRRARVMRQGWGMRTVMVEAEGGPLDNNWEVERINWTPPVAGPVYFRECGLPGEQPCPCICKGDWDSSTPKQETLFRGLKGKDWKLSIETKVSPIQQEDTPDE